MASESTLFKDADKEFLTCSICRDIYRNPKQLKCMHNFCEECLEGLIKKGTTRKIRCPICREEVDLDVDTVTKMKSNIFLSNLCELYAVAHLKTVDMQCSICAEPLVEEEASRCMDCSDNLCGKCTKAHSLTRLTRNHQVILMADIETETVVRKTRKGDLKMPCQKHPNNHLEYFCKTCQAPVCLGCTVVDHAFQNGHTLLDLQDVPTKEGFVGQISEQIKRLEEVIPSFEKNICIANESEMNVIDSLEKTKNNIRETTKNLIEEIEAHSKALIEKVDKKADVILKIIEHHRESAEIKVKSSNGINQFARNLCKHGLNVEIMSSAKDLLRRMNELQEYMDLVGTGELRFNSQKQFKLGIVEECKLQEREGCILKAYAEKEIAANQQVKRGPNWPAGFDKYDNSGQKTTNTIYSIERNGQNDVNVKVLYNQQQYYSGIHFGGPRRLPPKHVDCKMNPGEYWLQPNTPNENYMGRLACYANNFMQIGDEVKRGLHWPQSWVAQDDKGMKSGKITEINRDDQGNATAVVEFGPAPYDAIECPMYPGCYYLLPLKPFPLVNWVEF